MVAILGVLAGAVVIVINPSDLLAQARGSTRQSDLDLINKSLSLYQLYVGASTAIPNTIYVSLPDSSPTCGTPSGSDLGLITLPTGWSYACVSSSTYKKIDGTGWIPLNFNNIPASSPMGVLPVDPVNSGQSVLYYTYAVSGSSWELTAILESKRGQTEMINDGGADPLTHETGTSLTVSLFVHGLVGYWPLKHMAD